jgi:hypothetical protein
VTCPPFLVLLFAKTLSAFYINNIRPLLCTSDSRYQPPMFRLIRVIFASSLCFFRARRSLLLEHMVLRHQLAVLKRKRPAQRLTLDRRPLVAALTATLLLLNLRVHLRATFRAWFAFLDDSKSFWRNGPVRHEAFLY